MVLVLFLKDGKMHENFDEDSKKAAQCAETLAKDYFHQYLGTEHILYGLIERDIRTQQIFTSINLDYRRLRIEIETTLQQCPITSHLRSPPKTENTKKAIFYAIEAAREKGRTNVSTEDLLLGLLSIRESVAYKILGKMVLEGNAPYHSTEELISKIEEAIGACRPIGKATSSGASLQEWQIAVGIALEKTLLSAGLTPLELDLLAQNIRNNERASKAILYLIETFSEKKTTNDDTRRILGCELLSAFASKGRSLTSAGEIESAPELLARLNSEQLKQSGSKAIRAFLDQ